MKAWKRSSSLDIDQLHYVATIRLYFCFQLTDMD